MGAASSAAAVGVAARWSAAKSAMVKSVSWPMPVDDRNPAGTDRPSNGFGVECPEVFQAAASAAEDQGVAFVSFAGHGEGRGDLLGGAVALHQRRDRARC
jgi:hypothetical protein